MQMVHTAMIDLEAKKHPIALSKVRFESVNEGACAQILHVGPFSDEGPTVERLHQYIDVSGFARSEKHHEIILSDIRRADPARWRTVIRQPYDT